MRKLNLPLQEWPWYIVTQEKKRQSQRLFLKGDKRKHLNTNQLKIRIAKDTIKKRNDSLGRNKCNPYGRQRDYVPVSKELLQIVKKKIINLICKLQISNCMRGNPNNQHTRDVQSFVSSWKCKCKQYWNTTFTPLVSRNEERQLSSAGETLNQSGTCLSYW